MDKNQFRAIVINKNADNINYALEHITRENLSVGNVFIKVAYSGVNYKDMLAFQANSGVVAQYPIIPGIDLCGEVLSSSSCEFKAGDRVIATGFGIGVSHSGGYAEYAQIPSQWLIKLPNALSFKDSMALGTAGFSAALCILALEKMGMQAQNQPNVLVSGATGGVGSIAIALLYAKGYKNITALSSKQDKKEYLLNLGAKEIINPQTIINDNKKPLNKQKFHYAIDCVGGDILSSMISQIYYNGCIALCGNAGGIKLQSNVLPFILRNVSLLGIDSVNYPIQNRDSVWNLLASLKKEIIHKLDIKEVTLQNLENTLYSLQNNLHIGRSIIKVGD